MTDRASWCDLTVTDGAPTIRLRSNDLDVIYPLTPSEAAALIRRLATSIEQLHAPPGDRTATSLAHPDNDTLRETKDPAA